MVGSAAVALSPAFRKGSHVAVAVKVVGPSLPPALSALRLIDKSFRHEMLTGEHAESMITFMAEIVENRGGDTRRTGASEACKRGTGGQLSDSVH